ncbi:MAG: hypothetical protein ACKV22_14510 [Bryobacteraceae bacterium]
MEFVPGLGLYGTDGTTTGYLIDPATGRATLLHPLIGSFSPLNGLAYSTESGRLIASSADYLGSTPGRIYNIDPVSGAVTLLNDQAPSLVGIAEITIPEPRLGWLFASGLAALALRRRGRVVRRG